MHHEISRWLEHREHLERYLIKQFNIAMPEARPRRLYIQIREVVAYHDI